MSRNLMIKGIFKNGKERTIGIYNPKNSELEISLFNNDDIEFLNKVAEMDKKCFNWCIENNKFKKIEVIYYSSTSKGKGKEVKEEVKLNKRIDKTFITNLVNKYNHLDVL